MRWGILTAIAWCSVLCMRSIDGAHPLYSMPLVSYTSDLERLSSHLSQAVDQEAPPKSFKATTCLELPDERSRAFTSSLGVALNYSGGGNSNWHVGASDNLGTRSQQNMPSLRYHKQEGTVTYTRNLTAKFDLLAKAAYTRASTRSPLILDELQQKERVLSGGMGLSTEIVPQMWLAVVGEAVHLHNSQGQPSRDASRLRLDISAKF